MAIDPNVYLNTYKDVKKAYNSLARKGTLKEGKGQYFKAYGKNLNEKNWVNILNKEYGRDATDVSAYDANEFATAHFNKYGKKERRHKNKAYKQAAKKADTAEVDLTTFQSLLDKLEGSKKRQQRQKSVEGRRDIYAQGLASMMSNF